MTVKYRLDWDGKQNVVLDNTANGGHIEMTLGEFVKLADKVITGTFEPENRDYKKSFRLLPALAAASRG
ncbi:hypothetical protein ACN2CC_20340 [Mesorhizobium muleiense]|uniref:hypothetical protein n=1 Tax=Mesorhizobium muleiense TaxID=1004279 RepID=UPI003AFA257C